MIEEMRITLQDITGLTVACSGKQEANSQPKPCGTEITIDPRKTVDRSDPFDLTGSKCPACGTPININSLKELQRMYADLLKTGADRISLRVQVRDVVGSPRGKTIQEIFPSLKNEPDE